MDKPVMTSYPEIPGVMTIKLDRFSDKRGTITELYDFDLFRPIIGEIRAITSTKSVKNTIRGLHSDNVNWKCLKTHRGKLQYFLYDLATKKQLEFILSEEDNTWVVVPPGILNGTAALEDSELLYLWSYGYVAQDKQIHRKWNEFGFEWKVKDPILSERDK